MPTWAPTVMAKPSLSRPLEAITWVRPKPWAVTTPEPFTEATDESTLRQVTLPPREDCRETLSPTRRE